MNNDSTRLECLPNEILFEIFEYIDCQDIYRAFDNLNVRFNVLIRSLDQLFTTFPTKNDNQEFVDQPYYSSVHTLIVNNNAKLALAYFPNLRHLIIHWLPHNVLDKLGSDVLPNLEYLSIDSRISSENCSIVGIADQIFTNNLPKLKFCALPNTAIKPSQTRWTETPALKVLKVGEICLSVYATILSSCPNLRIFECSLDQEGYSPADIQRHLNMKTLVIKQTRFNEWAMNKCLSQVPNVQRVDICIAEYYISRQTIQSYVERCKSIIDSHLLNLRQMNYHVSCSPNHMIFQLERHLNQIQNNHYKIRFIITEEEEEPDQFLD